MKDQTKNELQEVPTVSFAEGLLTNLGVDSDSDNLGHRAAITFRGEAVVVVDMLDDLCRLSTTSMELYSKAVIAIDAIKVANAMVKMALISHIDI